jgi:hypothetical protein
VRIVADSLRELRSIIEGQLKHRQFLYVPPSKVEYWENEEFFGEEVAQNIPEAREDIYEACSCFAVGRHQATVYHCMGIMQAAAFKVGVRLGQNLNIEIDGWPSTEKKIQAGVDVLRKQAEAKTGDALAWAEWKRLEALYAELISDLNAARKAWRDTGAHFRQRYNEEQAEKVLARTGEFVRQVARLLA